MRTTPTVLTKKTMVTVGLVEIFNMVGANPTVPTLMLGMQVTREIVNLLKAIAHILEVTSSPSNHRNRR